MESDPLIRWCPSPGCEGWVAAFDFNASKLHCPLCDKAICFRCRDEWHGRWTSCEKNQEKKF